MSDLPTVDAVRAHMAKGGLWLPVPRPRELRGKLRQEHTYALGLSVAVGVGGEYVAGPGGASLDDIVKTSDNAFLVGATWRAVEAT